ncbi:MAG: hypothetical protein M5U28_03560 [Sandaracinaceae bacterium]|nr:hypothetical protein [Sandaracinaceae bacterium]
MTLEFFEGRKIYAAIGGGLRRRADLQERWGSSSRRSSRTASSTPTPTPGTPSSSWARREAPILGVIDLGLRGRLTPQMREKTIDLMISAVQEGSAGLADALYAIGTPTRKIDRRARSTPRVARLADRYLGKQLREIEDLAPDQRPGERLTKFGLEIRPTSSS